MKRLLGLALLALPVLSASNDAQVGGGGNPVGCVCNIAKSYEPNDPNVSGDPSLPPWVTGIAVLVHMPSPGICADISCSTPRDCMAWIDVYFWVDSPPDPYWLGAAVSLPNLPNGELNWFLMDLTETPDPEDPDKSQWSGTTLFDKRCGHMQENDNESWLTINPGAREDSNGDGQLTTDDVFYRAGIWTIQCLNCLLAGQPGDD